MHERDTNDIYLHHKYTLHNRIRNKQANYALTQHKRTQTSKLRVNETL